MQNRRLFGIILTVIFLLLIPLVAMQFTNQVTWTLSDFVVACILLFGAGLMCELIIRKVRTKRYRLALCAGVLSVLLLIWLELAVGIFGTPFAGH